MTEHRCNGCGHDLPAEAFHWDRMTADNVNRPSHYTSHPSGIECIEIVRHMGFNLGNVVKYVWRADLKGAAIEDLRKAQTYLADEIAKRERAAGQ